MPRARVLRRMHVSVGTGETAGRHECLGPSLGVTSSRAMYRYDSQNADVLRALGAFADIDETHACVLANGVMMWLMDMICRVTKPEHTLVGIHAAIAIGVHQRYGWTIVALPGIASNLPAESIVDCHVDSAC